MFDAIQAGHQDSGQGIVNVAGGIGVAQFKALVLGGFGVGGDAHHGRAVGGGIADGDRRFKAGHQALEGVGGGVGEGAQRGRVLQEAPDKPQGGVAQVGIAVRMIKEVFISFEQLQVHVHAAAGLI